MRRLLTGFFGVLCTLAVVPASADDRCDEARASVAILDAKLSTIAGQRDASWPDIKTMSANVQREQPAGDDVSAVRTWLCAVIGSRLQLDAGELRLLEIKLDLADDVRQACPNSERLAAIMSDEANTTYNRVLSGTDLLKTMKKMHCKGVGE